MSQVGGSGGGTADWLETTIDFVPLSEQARKTLEEALQRSPDGTGRLVRFLKFFWRKKLCELELLIEKPSRQGAYDADRGISVEYLGSANVGGQPVRRYEIKVLNEVSVRIQVGIAMGAIEEFVLEGQNSAG